jgi:dephospho-CoA kinase
MLVIGLTGGIGTGKTEVSRILADLGAEIINADALGHQAYEPQTETWRQVVEAFGEDLLSETGEVDRRKLGPIVFADERALKRLNAIVHPRIRQMIVERIDDLGAKDLGAVVVEAALFIEAGWTPLADEMWVTSAPEETVIKRLRARTGLDENAIRARIDSQMPQQERLKHADVIVENDGSLDALRGRVKRLWYERVTDGKESRLSR